MDEPDTYDILLTPYIIMRRASELLSERLSLPENSVRPNVRVDIRPHPEGGIGIVLLYRDYGVECVRGSEWLRWSLQDATDRILRPAVGAICSRMEETANG